MYPCTISIGNLPYSVHQVTHPNLANYCLAVHSTTPQANYKFDVYSLLGRGPELYFAASPNHRHGFVLPNASQFVDLEKEMTTFTDHDLLWPAQYGEVYRGVRRCVSINALDAPDQAVAVKRIRHHNAYVAGPQVLYWHEGGDHGKPLPREASQELTTLHIHEHLENKIENVANEVEMMKHIAREIQQYGVAMSAAGTTWLPLTAFAACNANLYVVTPHHSRGSLFKYCHDLLNSPDGLNPTLPLEQVRHFLAQVLHSVRFFHSQLIAHRDISLENILLEELHSHFYKNYRDLNAVLIDFAQAIVHKKLDVGDLATCEAMRANGLQAYELLVGSAETPGKKIALSPELRDASRSMPEGYRYDGLALDMFQVGVMLYQLVVGCAPFETHERDEKDVCRERGPAQWLPDQKEWMECVKQRRVATRVVPVTTGMDAKGRRHFIHVPVQDVIKDPQCLDLLNRLLEPEPHLRITAVQALLHPFLQQNPVS